MDNTENTSIVIEKNDYQGRNAPRIFFATLPAIIIVSLMAFFSEAGQVIWMPLWIDSPINGHSQKTNTTDIISIGSYPVVLTSSIFEFSLFTLMFLIFGRFGPNERYVNWKSLFVVSISNSINSVLTPFVSSGKRNAPYLQGLLLNSYVPFTVIVRFFVLKRAPTLKKFICVIIVTIALVISLLPNVVPSLIELSGEEESKGSKGFESFLWASGFMLFAVFPAVIMNVYQEKILKKNNYIKLESDSNRDDVTYGDGSVDIFYMNMIMALVQLMFAVSFVWLDILPHFGESTSIMNSFMRSKKALECSLCIGDCSIYTFSFTWALIISYCSSYVASSFMIKYAEGSTFFALVMNLVTPGVVLFWVLFDEQPFRWHPNFHVTKWFSVASITIMLPAIIIYNIGEDEKIVVWVRNKKNCFLKVIFVDSNRENSSYRSSTYS